ncbi:nose resistant to fluoxetine protein 6-like [Dermacentor variabilis]|uniref:nose resistant to fluoxetine protein 6-like n=1 Tax=Dermacentor variabilis TaxID=34621 RepID=UPI003F5C4A30
MTFHTGYILSYTINGTKNARGIKSAVVIALRRWYRLVLPLAFVAACFSLLPLFATGPTTSLVYDAFYDNVRSHWWAFLLNVRNFYPVLSYGPSAHTWYISADYQMFLAALIVHQVASRRAIVASLAVMSIASCSYTAWQVYGTEYTPVVVHLTETMTTYLNMLTDVYMLPFYHAACYFGGCITFYAVHKYEDRKLSKGVVAVLWAVAFCFGTACVAYRFEWTRGTKHGDLAKVSLAFCDRTIWATALAALTFLCVTGRGGLVGRLLSAAPLAVLSRLSFGVYLIHFLFYFVSHNAARERRYAGVYASFSESASVFVWSCILALALFLACEAPLGRLDKIIWGQPPQKKEKPINGIQDPTQSKEAP